MTLRYPEGLTVQRECQISRLTGPLAAPLLSGTVDVLSRQLLDAGRSHARVLRSSWRGHRRRRPWRGPAGGPVRDADCPGHPRELGHPAVHRKQGRHDQRQRRRADCRHVRPPDRDRARGSRSRRTGCSAGTAIGCRADRSTSAIRRSWSRTSISPRSRRVRATGQSYEITLRLSGSLRGGLKFTVDVRAVPAGVPDFFAAARQHQRRE